MKRKILLGLAMAVACQSLYGSDGSASTVKPSAYGATSDRAITLAMAQSMISGCTAQATAKNFPPLSIAVIDATGTLIAFARQDSAIPAVSDMALLKARSALRTQTPTSALSAAVAQDPPTRDALMVLQLVVLPGGVPLALDGHLVIGAVGVSGGMADQDESCANAAVSAVLQLRGGEKQ